MLADPASVLTWEESKRRIREIHPMTHEVLGQLDTGGVAAAVAFIARQDDQLGAIQGLHEAVVQLYWKRKALRDAVILGWAGIEHAVALVANARAGESVPKLRSIVKTIAYNIGSFTWPGWAEPDIQITTDDLEAGARAARLNLQLAIELEKPALALGRAHWLVGAHQLVAGAWANAEQSFGMAAELVGEASEALLNRGYQHLAATLGTPEDQGRARELAHIRHQLESVEHGSELIAQLDTARKTFLAQM